MSDKWYDHTPQQIAERLGTDMSGGLSRAEADSRLKKNGGNIIYPVPKGAFRAYLGHVMTDSMSILLLLTAVIQAALEHSAAAVALIVCLAVNYIAAVLTYIKAQKVLEDTASGALPVARVMRDGMLYLVRAEDLVVGDVIVVSSGDVVPADCRLIESNDLYAFEAPVTGVPKAQKKDANFRDFHELEPSQQKNMLLASTILTRGSGRAMVVASGQDNLVCREKKAQSLVRHEELAVVSTLKKYCSGWSLCMIVLVFLLTIADAVTGMRTRGLFDVFLTGLSLAVASMSELYTAFGHIIIACGVYNAVHQFDKPDKGALIRNVGCIDKLKDVSTVIIPKDGILMSGGQSVESVYTGGVEYTDDAPNFGKRCSMLLRFAVISTALYGKNKLSVTGVDPDVIHTAEEKAIVAEAEKHKLYNVALDRDYPILDHMSAGGPSRFETSLVGNFAVENLGNGIDGISDDSRPHKEGEDYLVCCRGELTAILARCRTYTQNGAMVPLDTAASADIRASALARGRAAYRVVGIATKTTSDNDLTRIENLQSDLNFEGFLAIREPILPGAARNMAKLRAAGISVIMLCDDLSENNLQIAKTVGIANNSTDVMQSKQMDRTSDGMLRTNIRSYRVYEALRLDQKKKLIDFLRAEGETVMFMGGKLDEIGLMREADVGVGKSVTISIKGARGELRRNRNETEYIRTGKEDPKLGCEALKFAADVIVSESDDEGNGSFNALVGAIASAKVIYQNILRMVRYLITSQLARLFIVLYSVIVRYEMMSPAQIIFTGLIVDFAAVMIIAFERPSHDILRLEENTSGSLSRPLAHNITCVAFGLFWAGAGIAAPLLADATVFALEPAQTGAAVFIGFLLAQAVVLSETMKSGSVFMPNVKFNFIYAGVIGALIAFVAVAMLTPLGQAFGITVLPVAGWLCALIPPAVLLLVYEIYKVLYAVYLSARRWKEKREM